LEGRGGKEECGCEDLGRVLNLTGANALGPEGLDMYIFEEGELEMALRDDVCGEGSEFFQRVMVSPLNMAEGSIIPDSAWAVAGSNMRLSLRDCLLSLFTDWVCSVLVSDLFTTVDCVC